MRVFPILCLVSLTSSTCLVAQQDVEFTEVLLVPVGSNTATQLVEITNNGPFAADLTGWRLPAGSALAPLPAMSVPPGGIVLLHP